MMPFSNDLQVDKVSWNILMPCQTLSIIVAKSHQLMTRFHDPGKQGTTFEVN